MNTSSRFSVYHVAPSRWSTLGIPWLTLRSSGDRIVELRKLSHAIAQCKNCPLYRDRLQAVPGWGNPFSPLLFIGEGPGAQEDIEGQPFVGRAGMLLTSTLASLGIPRNIIYIANVVKCRPEKNRTPRSSEMRACFPFLIRQIHIIRPRILVLMGNPALETILGEGGITTKHGHWFTWNNMWVYPIFHPAYVLRNFPKFYPLFLQDLQKLKSEARDRICYSPLEKKKSGV